MAKKPKDKDLPAHVLAHAEAEEAAQEARQARAEAIAGECPLGENVKKCPLTLHCYQVRPDCFVEQVTCGECGLAKNQESGNA